MKVFYPRWQKTTIKHLMSERRVLLLSGPRQRGKTALARELESDRTEYRNVVFLQASFHDQTKP